MRSVKKGSLSFGLVNVATKMYSATEDHDVKAHMHHGPTCLGGITMQRVCKECSEVVEYRDTVKGIEHGDQTVIITPEDLAALDEEQGPNFDVLQFVERDEIDPILFESTYYLDADKGAEEVYALVRQALLDTERYGIVQFAYRQKTRMGVLRVIGNVLAIHTIRWHDEVRGAEELHGAAKEVTLNPKMVELAHAVVDSLTSEWVPTAYADTYTEKLGQMVEAKAAGGEYVPAVEEDEGDGADVSDLLAKLEASIAKKPKKAKKAALDASVERHPAGRKRAHQKAS